MLQFKEKYVSAVMVKSYLKENYGINPRGMSGDEVIARLFGDHNNDYRGVVRIINDRWKPTSTPLQRLNRFWAYPLTILCLPYQYVVRRETGWSDQTKFGEWILRVTGCL